MNSSYFSRLIHTVLSDTQDQLNDSYSRDLIPKIVGDVTNLV